MNPKIQFKRKSLKNIEKQAQILIPNHYANTFTSILEPKRISYDVNLFLQVHRKMSRRNKIEKTFETNNKTLNNISTPATLSTYQGFRGKKMSSQKMRKRRFTTKDHDCDEKEKANDGKVENHKKQRLSNSTLEVNKVNLMCNLDLYRKKYRATSSAEKERDKKTSTLANFNFKLYKNKVERAKQNLSAQSLRT